MKKLALKAARLVLRGMLLGLFSLSATARVWADPSVCSNFEKQADRVLRFLEGSRFTKAPQLFERIEKAYNVRQGGIPVKPLAQFPTYVERVGGKIKKIYQVDPTHPDEVEVFSLDGKHIGVENFEGQAIKPPVIGRKFWKN